MCIILVKEKGIELPDDFARKIQECMSMNKHGSGFAYKKKNGKSIYISKGYFTYDKAMEAIERLHIEPEDEFMFHARISTSGHVNTENCHPFVVHDEKEVILFNNGFTPYPVMSHNGIFSGYTFHESDYNDTYHYVKQLVGIPYLRDMLVDMPEVLEKVIKAHTGGCRVAFMFPGNNPMYLFNRSSFDEEAGILYSNQSHKYYKDPPYSRHNKTGFSYPSRESRVIESQINRELSFISPHDRRLYAEDLFDKSLKKFEDALAEVLKVNSMSEFWKLFMELSVTNGWNLLANDPRWPTVMRIRKYFQSIVELKVANNSKTVHLLPSSKEVEPEEEDIPYAGDSKAEKFRFSAKRAIDIDVALTGKCQIKRRYGTYDILSDMRLRIPDAKFPIVIYNPFKDYNIEIEANASGRLRAVVTDYDSGKLDRAKRDTTILVPIQGNTRYLPHTLQYKVDYAFKTGIHIVPKCFAGGTPVIGYQPIYINPLELFNNFKVVTVNTGTVKSDVLKPLIGQTLKWRNKSNQEVKIVNYGQLGNPRGLVCYINGVIISSSDGVDKLSEELIKDAILSGASLTTMSNEGTIISTFRRATVSTTPTVEKPKEEPTTKMEPINAIDLTTIRAPEINEAFMWRVANDAWYKATFDGTGYNIYRNRELQSTDYKTCMEHISEAITDGVKIRCYAKEGFPQLNK